MKLSNYPIIFIGLSFLFITCKKDEVPERCETIITAPPNEYAHLEGNFYADVADNWGYGDINTSYSIIKDYDLVVHLYVDGDSLKGLADVAFKIDSVDQTDFFKWVDPNDSFSIYFSEDYSQVEMYSLWYPSWGPVSSKSYVGQRTDLPETTIEPEHKEDLSGSYLLEFLEQNTEEEAFESGENVFEVINNDNGYIEVNGNGLSGTSNFHSYKNEFVYYEGDPYNKTEEIHTYWANDTLDYSFIEIIDHYSGGGIGIDTLRSVYNGTKTN